MADELVLARFVFFTLARRASTCWLDQNFKLVWFSEMRIENMAQAMCSILYFS
jgi:hypothetical protein